MRAAQQVPGRSTGVGWSVVRRAAVASALVTTMCVTAAAQPPAADSARRDTAVALAPFTVTAARLGATASGAPVLVRAVAPPQGGGRALASALARLPVAAFHDDQGTTAQPTIDVRGFLLSPVVGIGQGLSVFLDGVRVNEPDAHEVHFDLIPAAALAGGELLLGPLGQFGKNTLGGALNLRTLRGDEAPGWSARAFAGAFGQRGVELRGGLTNAGFDVLLAGVVSRERGFRERSSQRVRSLFANVGRRGARSDAAVTLLVAGDSLEQPGSLPESWLATRRTANYTGGDFFRPRLVHVSGRYEARRGRVTTRANAFARRNAIRQFNANVDDPDTDARITNQSGGAVADVAISLGERGPVLAVGAEFSLAVVRHVIGQIPNARSPVIDDECDARTRECERARTSQYDAGAYVELARRGRLGAWSVAVRADAARVNFRDLREPENDGLHEFRRATYRAAAELAIAPRLSAYASFGTSFRVPAALELACADADAPCPLPFSLGDDPPLAPVRSRGGDAALKWSPAGAVALEISAFRADLRDEIMFAQTDRAAHGFFVNVARTRRSGVELRGVATAGGARLEATHGIVYATFRSPVSLASVLPDNTVRAGDRLPMVPTRRSAVTIGTAEQPHGLHGGLTVKWTGPRHLRGDESNSMPRLSGYSTADVAAGWSRSRFSVEVAVANALNRRFESFGTYAVNSLAPDGEEIPPRVERFLTPGEPRRLTLGIRIGAR